MDENVLIADSELKLKDAIDKTVRKNKKKSLFTVRRQCLIVSNIDSPVVVSLNSELHFTDLFNDIKSGLPAWIR